MDWQAIDKATAIKLRQWMKDNSWAMGQVHVIDAREDRDLQAIVADYGPVWEGDSWFSWRVMRVDQLINVYIRS